MAIELLNSDNIVEEENDDDNDEMEPSYDDDNFEEPVSVREKVYVDRIEKDKVKQNFEELPMILQIKKIKYGDMLKFLLHGIKDSGKKIKKVSIECLKDALVKKVGLSEDVSLKLARYLVEVPNEEGKIE